MQNDTDLREAFTILADLDANIADIREEKTLKIKELELRGYTPRVVRQAYSRFKKRNDDPEKFAEDEAQLALYEQQLDQ